MAGRAVQLGGLVAPGSVKKFPDGRVEFVITDNKASATVGFHDQFAA